MENSYSFSSELKKSQMDELENLKNKNIYKIY
jgi:hypothetical protein